MYYDVNPITLSHVLFPWFSHNASEHNESGKKIFYVPK